MGSRRLGLAEEDLTYDIIGAFLEVYHEMGAGLSESVYVAALKKELKDRGHRVEREVRVPIYYKGELVAWQRLDLVVDDKVIVEAKAGESLPVLAHRQPQSYVRGTRFEIALLFHFGPEARHYRFYCPNSQKRLMNRERLNN